MNIAILVVSSLSFLTSAALLYVVVTAANELQDDVDNLKTRTNESLEAMQKAAEALKF